MSLSYSIYPKVLVFCIVIFTTIFFSSCEKDFEELNENPFFPTQTESGPLFNSVIESLTLGWDEQFYLHNESLYGITQLAALTAKSFQNISIGTEDIWKNYYTTLANVRELERRYEEIGEDMEELNNVRAQVKIILAYKTFRLTDLFGDVPFFDAGKSFESLQFVEPKFDSQEDIYKFLLNDLKWAVEHIITNPGEATTTGEAYVSFGTFDNLFNNDLSLWLKFANSLRLKHALRMYEKDEVFAGEILKEILENDLPVIEDGEEVALYPDKLSWQKESTHWSFREHNNLRMGSNIWNLLSESDAVNGSGIFDPRAKIWFEPNNNNEWVAFPQDASSNIPPSGGFPYAGSRDVAYNVKGQSNVYSPFNYYLIRDQNQIPEILLSPAEIRFIKAEVYFRGLGIAKDEDAARSEYTLGVVSSIKFWQNLVLNTSIWENSPPILSEGEIFSVTNHPKISIFGSNEPLKLIYTQRFLDLFRQPWEAYGLTRRTGDTPRIGEQDMQYRFAYPPSETSNNPTEWAEQVGRMGEDSPRVKVWWMP